jgi:hypothetical protein
MKKTLVLLFILFSLFSITFSQVGNIDQTFNPTDLGYGYGDGADLGIRCSAIQNDGKILVGGWFSSYKGITANRIIRLNTDGSNDTSFVTGTGFNISNGNSTGNVNQPVRDIVIQNDGKECFLEIPKGIYTYEVLLSNKDTFKKGEYKFDDDITIIIKKE